MNPLGAALNAYHLGQQDVCFTIKRDDGFQQVIPVSIFFEASTFPLLERRALDLSRGVVLDVGAGAGRHTLELQRRGLEVWSLDVLPEVQSILSARGALHPVVGDIFFRPDRSFDTVLMLMNGLGLVGNPNRLDEFLKHAHCLVSPGGQILCDSIDVSVTKEARHVSYRQENLARGFAPGQQRFTIKHQGLSGESFDWLHLDFASLSRHCKSAGWECLLLGEDIDGRYLARIVRPGTGG